MTYTASYSLPAVKRLLTCVVSIAPVDSCQSDIVREAHAVCYMLCNVLCASSMSCSRPMLCAEPPAKRSVGPKSRKRKAKEEDDADVQPTVSSTTNKQKAAPYKLPEVHLTASLHLSTHKCHHYANTNTASAAFRLRSLKFALQKLFVVQSDIDCWWIRLTNGFDTCKDAITLQPHALQDDITDACILYGSCKPDNCSLLSHADSL